MGDNRHVASERPYARGRGRREEPSGRTVGEVAALAHITVRALHHYDEIGLVSPSGRSDAGYRLYQDADLERLQQVLIYRELGFRLHTIRELMMQPDFDRGAALREQRHLLAVEGERLRAMLNAVDNAIAAYEGGYAMTPQEMLEVFGEFELRQYEDEARERWGDTEAFQQSAEKTSQYGVNDWTQIKAEVDQINQEFMQALDSGVAATSEAAMGIAEQHRQHISRWFYECSPEFHRNLGEMYVQDERFTATYEAMRTGLARFVRDAVVANAEHRL